MSKVKVCLDAGHVGSKYNQSPVVKTYYESTMVWKLHLLLKTELEKRGFEVITTRPNIDTDLTVYNRGAAAKGCDVFISLHSNACGTESVDYPVIYRAYDNANNVDALALPIAKKVGELMGTKQAGRTAILKNSAGGEYYGVLRGARAVGVPYYMLIEHSFHTNTAATKWLLKDANIAKLAVAEAELLAQHFGIQAEPKPEGKTSIMGDAIATAAQMALFCRSKNPTPKLASCSLEELAQMFLEEGKAATFPNPRTGIRAQVQHLKAYASTAPLVNPCVDPRFSLVSRGAAEFAEWLGAEDNPGGRGWAVPGKGYGEAVVNLLAQIIAQETPQSPVTPPEDPETPNYPAWQLEGFQALVDGGIINSPEVWLPRFTGTMTVGEIMGILGRLLKE